MSSAPFYCGCVCYLGTYLNLLPPVDHIKTFKIKKLKKTKKNIFNRDHTHPVIKHSCVTFVAKLKSRLCLSLRLASFFPLQLRGRIPPWVLGHGMMTDSHVLCHHCVCVGGCVLATYSLLSREICLLLAK